MGFDISDITITSPSASALQITNNSKTMTFNSSGNLLLPGTPLFTASGSAGAWESPAASATWYTILFPVTYVNVGSCFNTTTGIFTAPVSGTYIFTFSAYVHFQLTATNDYIHPAFLCNGSWGARGGGGGANYRLRGHGYTAYYDDLEMSQIYRLQTSDTMRVYVYCKYIGDAIYSNYKLFTGTFLG